VNNNNDNNNKNRIGFLKNKSEPVDDVEDEE